MLRLSSYSKLMIFLSVSFLFYSTGVVVASNGNDIIGAGPVSISLGGRLRTAKLTYFPFRLEFYFWRFILIYGPI